MAAEAFPRRVFKRRFHAETLLADSPFSLRVIDDLLVEVRWDLSDKVDGVHLDTRGLKRRERPEDLVWAL